VEIKEANSTLIEGEIERDMNGFLYCKNCSINPNSFQDLKLYEGQQIRITKTAINNNTRTNDKYSLYARRIEIIQVQ